MQESNIPEEEWRKMPMYQLSACLDSKDESIRHDAVLHVLQMSHDYAPPTKDMIEAGIVSKLVNYLDLNDTKIQLDACWALARLAGVAGLHNYSPAKAVVKSGAAFKFVQFLSSTNLGLVDASIYGLANIAAEGPELRDYVTLLGTLDRVLPLVEPAINFHLYSLHNIIWTLRNLCRFKTPPPKEEVILQCMPVFVSLIQNDDIGRRNLAGVCSALEVITHRPLQLIDLVIEANIIPRLVEFLESDSACLTPIVLHIFGNIALGTDTQRQAIIDSGVLPQFGRILLNAPVTLQKKAALVISTLTLGTPLQIQAVIDCQLLQALTTALSRTKFHPAVHKDVLLAVKNFTFCATPDQLLLLMTPEFNLHYCRLLRSPNVRLVQLVLDGLINITNIMSVTNQIEMFSSLIKASNGVRLLTKLQTANPQIAACAKYVLMKCLGELSNSNLTAFHDEYFF